MAMMMDDEDRLVWLVVPSPCNKWKIFKTASDNINSHFSHHTFDRFWDIMLSSPILHANADGAVSKYFCKKNTQTLLWLVTAGWVVLVLIVFIFYVPINSNNWGSVTFEISGNCWFTSPNCEINSFSDFYELERPKRMIFSQFYCPNGIEHYIRARSLSLIFLRHDNQKFPKNRENTLI